MDDMKLVIILVLCLVILAMLFFNTKDSNLYTVEEETNERKIVERRGDAKEGDLWIHPNTGNLKMKVGDKWVTVNDYEWQMMKEKTGLSKYLIVESSSAKIMSSSLGFISIFFGGFWSCKIAYHYY